MRNLIGSRRNGQQLAELWKVFKRRGCVQRRRLDLLIAQGKLLQTEAKSNTLINDLWKTLATKQFRASISQEKVRAILKRHIINTLKMVKESMDKGWKTWSAQAAELQPLRVDRENRKAQGQGFFKMLDEAISVRNSTKQRGN